jgi:hypothetical protein
MKKWVSGLWRRWVKLERELFNLCGGERRRLWVCCRLLRRRRKSKGRGDVCEGCSAVWVCRLKGKIEALRLAEQREVDGSCEGEKFSNWGGRRRGWSSGVVAGEKELKTWGTFCRGGNAGGPVEGAVRRR